MSGLAFALVLTAALLHAAWNFLLKRINAGPELVWLFSVLILIIYLPVAVAVWVIEKPQFDLVSGGFVLGSSLLHLGYLLVLQQGYRRGDLSLVYPTARATGPFLSTIFAVIILGEALTPQVAVGAAAIIGGVFFLTGGLRRGRSQVTTSLLFGVATGALIGTYTVWDAYTVTTLMVSPILLDYASSITRSVALMPYAMKHRTLVFALWRNHRYRVLGVAIFSPLAYTLVLFAFTFTPVIYVAPLREVSVLLTVLMGTFLLGEASPGKRLGWAAVIIAGIALLAAA
jgi:drug/metabolite transporter (DMT)-like permease